MVKQVVAWLYNSVVTMCSIVICCSNIIAGYNILIAGCGSSVAVLYECYEAGYSGVIAVCRVFQAALCRCSQPLAGFSARCVEDEQMLQAIRRANPSSKFMYVIDTRPKVCTGVKPE